MTAEFPGLPECLTSPETIAILVASTQDAKHRLIAVIEEDIGIAQQCRSFRCTVHALNACTGLLLFMPKGKHRHEPARVFPCPQNDAAQPSGEVAP